MEEKNIYQRIQAVSNEIGNLEKDMSVGQGKYTYKAVSDLQVILAVKEAEQKHGLVSIPIKQELVSSEVVKTLKENGRESVSYVDIIKMTVRIVNVSDTTQFIEVESFGRGLDSSDKGFGKASTYARKYALLNAYKIATGEDPDKDKSKESETLSVDKKEQLVHDYMLQNNKYCQQILSYFNVGSIEDLTKKQIETVFTNLKTKNLL
jgi:hypothetical protein